VRANEIPRLVGSTARLHAAIGEQHHPGIEDTLRWMHTEAVRA
jgi:hypothetical protein